MIPPVQLVPPDNFQTNTPASNQQQKNHKRPAIDIDNWYCKKCDKYFSIPKHTKEKCDEVNCPYCGGAIIDNTNYKNGGDKFWMNI